MGALAAIEPPQSDTFETDLRRLAANASDIVSDLYARAPEGVPDLRGLLLVSCLRGALARDVFESRLTAHDFTLILWEDHTEALKAFTARLIFEHGSLASFWGCATGNPVVGEPIQQATLRARPGYFLALAKVISD